MTSLIKNFLDAPMDRREGSHGGSGPYELYEVWGRTDFATHVDFMDRMVVPPGSTVGLHKHGNNEEMYVVLEGQATMTVEGKPVAVKKGDMILNPTYGEHGLVNDSGAEIDLLIIQIGMER